MAITFPNDLAPQNREFKQALFLASALFTHETWLSEELCPDLRPHGVEGFFWQPISALN